MFLGYLTSYPLKICLGTWQHLLFFASTVQSCCECAFKTCTMETNIFCIFFPRYINTIVMQENSSIESCSRASQLFIVVNRKICWASSWQAFLMTFLGEMNKLITRVRKVACFSTFLNKNFVP